VPAFRSALDAVELLIPVIGFLSENLDNIIKLTAAWVLANKVLPASLRSVQTAVGSLATVLTAGLGAALIAIPELMDSFNVSLEDLAKSSGLTEEAVEGINERFHALAEDLGNDVSFSGFVSLLDGTKDNVRALTEELTPGIAALGELGFTAGEVDTFIVQLTETTNELSGGAIAGLRSQLEGNVEDIQRWGEELGRGEIPLVSFTERMAQLGFDTETSLRIANIFLGQFGEHVTETGRTIRNFAGLTDDALKDFRESVVDNIRSTFGTISTFDNQWTLSAREFEKNADLMAEQAAQFTEDLKVLERENISDALKKALLDEGPAALHAYAGASRETRDAILADVKAQADEFKKQKDVINDITGALDQVPGEKHINVKVHYSYDGYDPRMPIP
jgi:hypothetical protein